MHTWRKFYQRNSEWHRCNKPWLDFKLHYVDHIDYAGRTRYNTIHIPRLNMKSGAVYSRSAPRSLICILRYTTLYSVRSINDYRLMKMQFSEEYAEASGKL